VGEVKTDSDERPAHDWESYRHGRDELNLAEFPLAPIAERFLDGRKTVVLHDDVWDVERREMVPRELAISGSDRYGLPTAKDEDVLLACVQLSSRDDFGSREVHFSRYALLKLLRWDDSTRNYRRLLTSLRRWKGVTIYSTRAFYDHAAKSWVNRDFGLFDNLYVYEREHAGDGKPESRSWFVWNEVLYNSFQAGYLKTLDWDLYCRLQNPVAKRLYRFLDKRFYRQDRLTLDLHDLAFHKVRVSQGYNTAQVKRALQNGIRELEALWDLRPLPPEQRFVKRGRGRWEAVFERKPKAARERKTGVVHPLEQKLVERQVSAAVARSLVREHPAERIESMIELYDWHVGRGESRSPGFLVAGIRSADGFTPPTGFQTSAERRRREAARNSRIAAERELREQRETKSAEQEQARQQAYMSFWDGLSETEQAAFETAAFQSTHTTLRDGYRRSKGGPLQDQYRLVILREHFERRQKTNHPLTKGKESPPKTPAI
jgi:plasmid replication initiation protein